MIVALTLEIERSGPGPCPMAQQQLAPGIHSANDRVSFLPTAKHLSELYDINFPPFLEGSPTALGDLLPVCRPHGYIVFISYRRIFYS